MLMCYSHVYYSQCDIISQLCLIQLLTPEKMTKKRVRIHDEYKYNIQKRGKYCRRSPVQKYNLALAIDRYTKNGLSPSLLKKNIFDEFNHKRMMKMSLIWSPLKTRLLLLNKKKRAKKVFQKTTNYAAIFQKNKLKLYL